MDGWMMDRSIDRWAAYVRFYFYFVFWHVFSNVLTCNNYISVNDPAPVVTTTTPHPSALPISIMAVAKDPI
jgi:hypothetical protein